MKHTIWFIMGAALSCLALSAKAQPTNDNSLTLLIPKSAITNLPTNFVSTICVPIVVKFDTNVMVLTTQPQHQRPPEVEKTTYVKVFTVRRNTFADWTWVDSDGHTNREMKLLETKIIKETHRSFRITTKEEYLEEVK